MKIKGQKVLVINIIFDDFAKTKHEKKIQHGTASKEKLY